MNKSEKNTCYIFGNGPSLKNDISKIDNSSFSNSIFVVNYFAFSEYYIIIKPSYYLFADPGFWLDSYYGKEVDSEIITQRKHLYQIINDLTKWDLKILVPYEAYKSMFFQQIFAKNTAISIVFYNNTLANGFDYINKMLYKTNLAMPHMQNVLIGCLYVAINLGFEKIRIFGGDHSWTKDLAVNNDNEVCAIDYHFYDNKAPKLVPYKKTCGESYFMHELLNDFALMFKGYHEIRKYADYRKVKIINCTKDSYIDAFERICNNGFYEENNNNI